jgi:hypothetical protein
LELLSLALRRLRRALAVLTQKRRLLQYSYLQEGLRNDQHGAFWSDMTLPDNALLLPSS